MPMDLLSKAAMSDLGTLDFRICLTKEFCFGRLSEVTPSDSKFGPWCESGLRQFIEAGRRHRNPLRVATLFQRPIASRFRYRIT